MGATLTCSRNEKVVFARGLEQEIHNTSPKKLTWCLWFKHLESRSGNIELITYLGSTFNWRRFEVSNNNKRIWLRTGNSALSKQIVNSASNIPHNTAKDYWFFMGLSYNGDNGQIDFVYKDENKAIVDIEDTYFLLENERTTFNNDFWDSVGDAGQLELSTQNNNECLIEDVRIYNDFLPIVELVDVFEEHRGVNLGSVSPLKINEDNIQGISFDTASNRIWHYVDGNIFNTIIGDLATLLPDYTKIDDKLHIGRLVSDNSVVNNSYIGGLATHYAICKTYDEFWAMADGNVKISKSLDLNNIPETTGTDVNILCVDSNNNVYKSTKKISDLP